MDDVGIVSADWSRKYFVTTVQDEVGLVDAATTKINSAWDMGFDGIAEAHESLPTQDEDKLCSRN